MSFNALRDKRIGTRPLVACTLAVGLLASLPKTLGAQSEYFFPPSFTFDPGIPSPAEFLGYPIGTFHTRHDRIVAYLQELASLSDRATFQAIGMTYEHRPMPVLTVTSPANQARLEQIRQEHLASLEPGTAPALELPVIIHLGYGVHGNEPSSAEAAMLTAYWLVAGTGQDVVRYLNEAVVHIEPVLNPDGRDRHTHWANMNRAQPFVADPLDREHNEVWPGGRTNHYWFDLNRDWLPLVNPESKARIDWHHQWRANVVTDYHEMGSSSSYFFEPTSRGAQNTLIPERLYSEVTGVFAEQWAAALDDIGSLYFSGAVFDNSYPGYGSTYPNFLGGMAVLFEQASSRGHVQESSHHGIITFGFTIRNQLRTSIATVSTAVANREMLRQYQHDFFASAISEGQDYEVGGWVFGYPNDPTLNREFIELVLRHRIEVYELTSTHTVGDLTFVPGNAWVVPASQSMYRLARSIFERTETFPDSVFYDASTWTISLAYGMPSAELGGGRLPQGDRVSEVPLLEGANTVEHSSIAYLMEWSNSGASRALQAMQAAGVRAEAAFAPFTARTTAGDVSFGRGSISIPVSNQELNPDELLAAVQAAANVGNVPILSALTGRAVSGIDLGSGDFRPVRAPSVLIPMGEGVSSYEAGQLWHLLDQRIGMPVTKVDVTDLGRVNWADYDVLVLVSGNLSGFSGDGLERLKSWVRSGGTLIAQRSSAAWAARNGFTPNIDAPGVGRPADLDDDEQTEARRNYADARNFEGPQAIGGSIWQADLDITHPLGFGYESRFLPVWRDHSFFFAPSKNAYSTVARLIDGDPHLSGYISDQNREWLAGSPSVMTDRFGRGTVVLLVDNTNYRGYWRGTNRLFLNALFFGNHIQVP
ncbi:MAG: zinc carboxypeptidase [Gemmatimonadota bacterium]|nr:MAG: zinc carboxypeptidase [Gemmatimonadota bacterium]